MTPDCWGGGEQVVMKLLLGGGYVLAQLWRLPCSAAATAVWCVWAHTPRLCVCVRKGLPRTGGAMPDRLFKC